MALWEMHWHRLLEGFALIEPQEHDVHHCPALKLLFLLIPGVQGLKASAEVLLWPDDSKKKCAPGFLCLKPLLKVPHVV